MAQERAHVLVCLRNDSRAGSAGDAAAAGVVRTSPTTVRLEHSDMSPGVASISFEQVFDFDQQQQSTRDVFHESQLATSVRRVVLDGRHVTVVAAGAARAGKSSCMRGSNGVGVMPLAIAHVFESAKDVSDNNAPETHVLMSCLFARDDRLVDAFTRHELDATAAAPLNDEALIAHSVSVQNAAEAHRCFQEALDVMNDADGTRDGHLLIALFVERRRNESDEIQRGRLVVIDVHGSAIIEPVRQTASLTGAPSLFHDTHIPVHATLSSAVGHLLGNECSTFFIVVIQKAAQRQQQAIQSLLYACKAKDIKSSLPSEATIINSFTQRPILSEISRIPTVKSIDATLQSPTSPVYVLRTSLFLAPGSWI
ncbi:hypothetical protein PINS_up010803 [Pythium insidiosum]|nr:hypothetical protein PINS_up010803 [Pythium insidiosum]